MLSELPASLLFRNEAKQQESLKKANLLAADLETRIKRLNYAKATPS